MNSCDVRAGTAIGARSNPRLPPAGGLDRQRWIRPVLGLGGNFVLGDSLSDSVSSAAFSGTFGFVKTDSSVLVLDRQGQVLSSDGYRRGTGGVLVYRGRQPGVCVPGWFVRFSHGTQITWSPKRWIPLLITARSPAIASPVAGSLLIVSKREDGIWLVDGQTPNRRQCASLSDGPLLLRSDGRCSMATPGLHSAAAGWHRDAHRWCNCSSKVRADGARLGACHGAESPPFRYTGPGRVANNSFNICPEVTP